MQLLVLLLLLLLLLPPPPPPPPPLMVSKKCKIIIWNDLIHELNSWTLPIVLC